jgi:hypothetical protein
MLLKSSLKNASSLQKFSSSNPEPSKQQTQTPRRPRSNVYLKETGTGKIRKRKEIGPTKKIY